MNDKLANLDNNHLNMLIHFVLIVLKKIKEDILLKRVLGVEK